MVRYRAPTPDALVLVPLDALTAAYHRASGITHLLASPAPELLSALADGACDLAELLTRLATHFEITDADVGALRARLDELVDSGLVERA